MTKRRNRLVNRYNDTNDMDFLSREFKMLEDLDPDLREYFNEARLVKSTKTKKQRKKKARFSIGDQVEVNNVYGTIIYGPYPSDKGKDTYEIECENGDIITAEDDGVSIKAYVPPVEKEEDDDLL